MPPKVARAGLSHAAVADRDQPRGPLTVALPFALAAVAIGAVAFFLIEAPEEHAQGNAEEEVEASDGGVEDKEPPPRCSVVGDKSYRIGKATPAGDAGDEDLDIEPFAAEVGRSAALEDGYAVGVRREQGGSPVAEVVVLDARAAPAKSYSLGRSRGDMDPPIVRARPGGWAAAVLEPNAGGMAIRLARVDGDKLKWGAELEQNADESLGYDLALNDKVGVVAWDDLTDDGKRGRIMLATVDGKTLEARGEAVELSSEHVDAEQPRLVPRKGGFWLAYAARDREKKPAREPDGGERFAAERIEPTWLELVPLDANGKVDSSAQPVTAKDGFVLAFDLELGRDAGALLAWRDDDTPSGAGGGRVTLLLMSVSGSSQKQPVEAEDVGAGVPVLLPRWLALGDGEGRTQLAPLSDEGVLEGELRRERFIGRGQVLAARGDELLVARPNGRAVELSVVRCTREAAAPSSSPHP
jgi:hypothetical protein